MDPIPKPKERLLDAVRAAIRTRHYSRRTERAYEDWIRRYVLFHGKRHPREMGAAEVSAYLSHLAVERKVSLIPRRLLQTAVNAQPVAT